MGNSAFVGVTLKFFELTLSVCILLNKQNKTNEPQNKQKRCVLYTHLFSVSNWSEVMVKWKEHGRCVLT